MRPLLDVVHAKEAEVIGTAEKSDLNVVKITDPRLSPTWNEIWDDLPEVSYVVINGERRPLCGCDEYSDNWKYVCLGYGQFSRLSWDGPTEMLPDGRLVPVGRLDPTGSASPIDTDLWTVSGDGWDDMTEDGEQAAIYCEDCEWVFAVPNDVEWT